MRLDEQCVEDVYRNQIDHLIWWTMPTTMRLTHLDFRSISMHPCLHSDLMMIQWSFPFVTFVDAAENFASIDWAGIFGAGHFG